MRRILMMLAILFVGAPGLTLHTATPGFAYSYAAAGAEPVLDGREALFTAAASGDWDAAQKALDGIKADIDYLDQNEDPGIGQAFTDAVAAKNSAQLEAAFVRAASAEIVRRLNGARDNLNDYQAAKVLVVKAQRFYTAIAGDLAPDASKTIAAALQKALDAVGNPGVFGVGARKPDPVAFASALADILKALGKSS